MQDQQTIPVRTSHLGTEQCSTTPSQLWAVAITQQLWRHFVRILLCSYNMILSVTLSRCLLVMSTSKNETQARFHVLYLLRAQCFFCYISVHKKTSQSESPHRDCSSRIQRHTMAKTKVGKKQGAELCTVNIFFKNNTRTKMFLLNQILFLVKYNKINSIK